MISHPYPGLRPFDRQESAVFFGRDEQVDQLLDKLGETHFLAILGTSGSGKSSLVRAGLLAALDSGFMAGAGARWRVADMRPGDSPFRRLSGALIQEAQWEAAAGRQTADHAHLPGNDNLHEDGGIARLETALRKGSLALNWLLGVSPLPEGERLLILVDQFEELFRYRSGADREAAEFAALLLGASSHTSVYIVITLRSEFLGDCALFPDLPEAINAGLFLTPMLSPEQTADAIQYPARIFNGEVDDDLVRHLLRESEGERDQLPLLQHALTRLWDRKEDEKHLTREQLQAVGGLRQALEDHVEEAFQSLDSEQRSIAETMFRALADRGPEERDTRRPVPLSEVAALAKVGVEEVVKVVEVFRRSGRSFLMPPVGTPLENQTVIDISHEALIRQWSRLRSWTEDEAQRGERYQRLAASAARWNRGEGALWIDPDLEFGLQWRDTTQPTAKWADRYGGKFSVAMDFLDASLEQRELMRREEVARRSRALQRAKRTALAASLGLLVVACLAIWGWVERQHAIATERQRTLDLFDAGVANASLLSRNENYAQAQKILASTYSLDSEIPVHRRVARDLLQRYTEILGGRAQQVYRGPGVPLSQAAVSPDGRWVAACGERGTLVLFVEGSGELMHRLQGHDPGAQLRDCLFHPSGAWLASAGDDGDIVLWSLPDKEGGPRILRRWRTPDRVMALAISPDGRVLASGGSDNDITLWDAETGRALRSLKGHRGQISEVTGLAFSPDGSRLASASHDKTARIWEVATGGELHRFEEHAAAVKSVAFDPDGRMLATGGDDKRVILWDIERAVSLRVFSGHRNIIYGLGFAPEQREAGVPPLLIAGGFDRTLRLWERESGVTLRLLQGHTAAVNGIEISNGSLYSASSDGTVRRWDISLPFQRLLGVPLEPASVAISPSGNLLAMGSADGGLNLFSLPDLKPTDRVGNAHSEDLQRLTFSGDGGLLASGGLEGQARVWRIQATGRLEPFRTLNGHTDAVHGVAFSSDAASLATAGYDGRVGLFDIASGAGRFIPASKGQLLSVEFDPKDQLIFASARDERKVLVWNIAKDPPVLDRDFTASRDLLLWAELNAAGTETAVMGRDYTVTILDAAKGRSIRTLPGHENAVFKARFLPGDKLLATVSVDATVRFWDLSEGDELLSLRLPTVQGPPVPLWDFDLQCGPDGCWLAVPLVRGEIAVYDLGMLGAGDH